MDEKVRKFFESVLKYEVSSVVTTVDKPTEEKKGNVKLMVTPELTNYIKAELARGIKPSDLANFLFSQGWGKEIIVTAFNELGYRSNSNN